MKTSELTGALLDYWVARAHGKHNPRIMIGGVCGINGSPFRPSTNWSQGGPLIDGYEAFIGQRSPGFVQVEIMGDNDELNFPDIPGEGPTTLIAVCRAIVRRTYGDEVPDA